MHTVLSDEKCCETPERRFAGRAEMGSREDCDAPKLLICIRCGDQLVMRCGTSRSTRCSPCSETYRRRVMTVCGSGTQDVFVQGGSVLFVTLTAPGDGVHHLPSGARCPCSIEGGVNLATWNATSGKRWSRFVQELRRETGLHLEYFKGVEIQKRGAVHFHALFRVPKGHGGRKWKSTIRRLAIKHGFGHEIDCAPVPDEKVAGYIAKYASKATDERDAIPWCDKETGEIRLGEGRYRVWSSSDHWGVRMGQVRQLQQMWAKSQAASTEAWGGSAGEAGADARAGEAGPLDHKAVCSTTAIAPP